MAEKMEDVLHISTFEEIPLPGLFSSQNESRNVPAVIRGCTKDWKAFSMWNPSNGGLDYLQERAGSSVVEAMLSRSAPVFYGDLRSHERVQIPFSAFITSCRDCFQKTDSGRDCSVESEGLGPIGSDIGHTCSSVEEGASHQVYLAQVPILNDENKGRSPLEILSEDIQMPLFLEKQAVASINLWMNNTPSRSSTHYDPHHNLLCVIAGCKQVVLWPPSASPLLYPMPIYGEASNHSSVDLEKPDFSIHPRAEHSMKYSQKIILYAGDALFIPEGWFHQVDSEELTIAVNFWWRSSMMSSMLEHMDAYYLRRILRRLIDKEMNQMLSKSLVCNNITQSHACEQFSIGEAGHHDHDSDQQCSNVDMEGNKQKNKLNLHQLEPLALKALHQLVSLVHEHVNLSGQSQVEESTSMNGSAFDIKDEKEKNVTRNAFQLEDDAVAKVLRTLEPRIFQQVLLAMVQNFPRSLEALILHMLSPVGAEVLTRKFDEMDQQISEEDRNEFYKTLYGVFDDQSAAMDAILNGKESFGQQVLRNVLFQYLGLDYDNPKPSSS